VIDLTCETPLPLAAVVNLNLVPPARNGKKTHLSTLLRWILTGCKAPSGELVRLEGLRLGNRWMTTREALQRFAQALTPPLGDSPVSPPRTPGQRQRAAERAARRLEEAGI
jgi:hypothetical protein